ncbi:MAG: hypothetical protein FJ011_25725 [Chloroflexi bacterium]|nr:hypothetical protein [Chloroflexota bacterium]
MGSIGLMEQTQQFLNLTVPGNQDLDAKVRQLIEAEHLRKLAQYRRTDLALARKYGMNFEEFLGRRIPRQENYSWEVEQDAMAWESAIGGIVTLERQLRELRGLNG